LEVLSVKSRVNKQVYMTLSVKNHTGRTNDKTKLFQQIKTP